MWWGSLWQVTIRIVRAWFTLRQNHSGCLVEHGPSELMELLKWIKGREEVVSTVAAKGETVPRTWSRKTGGAKVNWRGLWKASMATKSKMVPKILSWIIDTQGWYLLKGIRLRTSRFKENEDSVLNLWRLRCSLGIQVEMPGWQLDEWVWSLEGSVGYRCGPGWPWHSSIVHSPKTGWDGQDKNYLLP